jgi:hypothetical protein
MLRKLNFQSQILSPKDIFSVSQAFGPMIFGYRDIP